MSFLMMAWDDAELSVSTPPVLVTFVDIAPLSVADCTDDAAMTTSISASALSIIPVAASAKLTVVWRQRIVQKV